MNYDASMFDSPPTNPAIFSPLGVVYTGVITPTFPTSLGLPIPWLNCGIGSEFPRFPTAVDIAATHPDERVVLIDGEPEPWNRGRMAGAWVEILRRMRAARPDTAVVAYDAAGVLPWNLSPRSGFPFLSAYLYGRQMLAPAPAFAGFDAIGCDLYVPPGYDARTYGDWARLKIEGNVRFCQRAGVSRLYVLFALRDAKGGHWQDSTPITRARLDMQVAMLRGPVLRRAVAQGISVSPCLWGCGMTPEMVREDEATAAEMVGRLVERSST